VKRNLLARKAKKAAELQLLENLSKKINYLIIALIIKVIIQ